MYESRIRSEQADLLMEAILKLQTGEDAYRFFEDLCTIPEIKSISQRLEVAELLRRKETYQKIAEQVDVSSATICRVSKCYNYGTGGYRNAIEKLEEGK